MSNCYKCNRVFELDPLYLYPKESIHSHVTTFGIPVLMCMECGHADMKEKGLSKPCVCCAAEVVLLTTAERSHRKCGWQLVHSINLGSGSMTLAFSRFENVGNGLSGPSFNDLQTTVYCAKKVWCDTCWNDKKPQVIASMDAWAASV
jgi:hypothetical protein